MAKRKLGSLMSDLRSICESKGFDEKSSALPEAQETNTVETKVENGMLYISERVHTGSYYHWWVSKGPVGEYYGFGGYNYSGFDREGRHWDE
jgi:hypothetical protein